MINWDLFTERYAEIIPDFDLFIKALERPFPIGLRLETPLEELSKISSEFEQPFNELSYYHVEGERKFWGGQLLHHHGGYFMQAFSSLLPVLALNPKETDKVWDMCAAPGGKTTHLSSLMNNKGHIVASEPDLNRRRVLRANLNRLCCANVSVYGGFAQELDFPDETFDKILLDGPCSSEGTFRHDTIKGSKRRKTNYLSYNESFRHNLHKDQLELLRHGLKKLKKGGELIYSTCTYDPLENEKIVNDLLKENSQVIVEDLQFPNSIEERLSPGLVSYNGESFNEELRKGRRVYPHYINSIGFYVIKLSRKA